MEWYHWIYLVIGLIFGGYIINRVLFWVGSFIWKWSKDFISGEGLWFPKNTTINDIRIDIKYCDGYDHDGKYNSENYYSSVYEASIETMFIPGLNILFSIILFSCHIIGFILAILVGIIRNLIKFCVYILWPYFLKWIWKFIKIIMNLIYRFNEKIKLINLIKNLNNIYKKTIYNILNLRIA